MKKFFDMWIPAAIVLALAAWLAAMGAAVRADNFHAFRLFGGATGLAALAVALCFTRRWARWIALGWAIDVLANIAIAIAFGARRDALVTSTAIGAFVILLLIGRPGAVRRFEPD